jgi:hypothetical protein
MLRTRFRVAAFETALLAKRTVVPRGSAFIYELSGPGAVRIVIRQLRGGRRVGNKCVAPTRARRSKPRCTRPVNRGTLTRQGSAGRNTTAFSGKMGKRPMAPGTYLATITARAAGTLRASAARTASFVIVSG